MDEFFHNRSLKGRVRFFGIRIGLCILILLVYIFIWRSARIQITENVIYPQVENLKQPGLAVESVLQSGSLWVTYNYGEQTKQLAYRPAFGFFFLVSIMALLFVSSEHRHYLILFVIQLLATIFAYLFLLWGFSGFQFGFVLVDAINGYLAPALSLALVPLVMRGKV